MIINDKRGGKSFFVPMVVFAFFAVYLSVFAWPAIRMAPQYQLFVFTHEHIHEYLILPGGALKAVSAAFVQLFYWPYVGILLLSLVLTLMAGMINRICNADGLWRFACLAPTVLLLMVQVNVVESSYFVLGLIFTLAMAALHVRCRKSVFAGTAGLAGFDLLVFCVVYLIAGSYALLGLLLIISLLWQESMPVRQRIGQMLLCIGFLIALPLVSAWLLYPGSTVMSAFTGSLPDNFFTAFSRRLCLMYLTLAGLLACVALRPLMQRTFVTRYLLRLQGIITMLLLMLPYAYALTQQRTMVAVKMVCDMQDGQWHSILGRAQGYKQLSRQETVMVNLALLKTGQLSSKLFDYPQAYAEQGLYLDLETDRLTPFIGCNVYEALELSNYAYRWAMEGVVMGIFSPKFIHTMAVESIVRHNYPLARKYIYYIRHSLCYRNEADALEELMYVDNSENTSISALRKSKLTNIDSKRKNIPQNNSLTDEFYRFNDRLKRNIEGNPQNKAAFDYLLTADLLAKNLSRFTKNIEQKYPLGVSLPTLYQQALVVYQVQREAQGMLYIPYSIDIEIRNAFKTFNATVRSYKTKADAACEMASQYGHTYWYYYVFNDIKK